MSIALFGNSRNSSEHPFSCRRCWNWLALCGPSLGSKGVFALGTVPTQIATALLIGGKSFDDPLVLVLIVVVAVVGLLILMPLARV